jgi:hypothetical protein
MVPPLPTTFGVRAPVTHHVAIDGTGTYDPRVPVGPLLADESIVRTFAFLGDREVLAVVHPTVQVVAIVTVALVIEVVVPAMGELRTMVGRVGAVRIGKRGSARSDRRPHNQGRNQQRDRDHAAS